MSPCGTSTSAPHFHASRSLRNVTYVDPSLGVRERRSQLVAWGFGQCDCERCVEEESEGKNCEDEGEGETKERSSDMDDLERELKAGLGVM